LIVINIPLLKLISIPNQMTKLFDN
jgi:hypothetical protein